MNLNKAYERNSFLQFLSAFIPDFSQDIREVQTQGFKVTSQAAYLGECVDLGLKVFEVVHSSSVDARVSLATDGFRLLKDSGSYRALIAYRPETGEDWRLSLLIATPEMTDKGGIGLEYSNPRRYSFYLGPSAKIKTPHQFLITGGPVSDLDDLKSRFSVEVVNKEFYKLISKSFTTLVGGASTQSKKTTAIKPQLRLPSVPEGDQTSLEFAVRLIGRIIFCWFLREKKSAQGLPLMPYALLSGDAVRSNPDYYHNVLEPIFFEVLNRPLEERKAAYLLEPFSLVPYLNGGLFSPQALDFYSADVGEQAIHQNTVLVPDSWFEDLFETLETYNFTIDENTSFDEELSIDPEILGRIFENLLAEINPETGESARRSTGSYYTPRAIVDYMVNESLVLYLQEKTGIAEGKLRQLVAYGPSDETKNWGQQEKNQVIDALEKLKLLDPACGSGAFPIGALQKIVFVLQQVDPSGKLWFERQVHNMSPELRQVIEREFSHQNFDYIRKLGIIRENIYGVDIQPIATEISRLRCFLTLIVDQYVDDAQTNRGVQPLPNLDFKFVTANSLIGLARPTNPAEGLQQADMFDDREKINQLKAIRDEYFNAFSTDREQLKDEFDKAQRELINQVIAQHGFIGVAKAELTRKLTEWEPFSHKTNGWFDADWMFGIAEGFDTIIGNPPYLRVDNIETNQKGFYKKLFKSSTGKYDLYYLFFEKAISLLKQSGACIYITPNKFCAASSGVVLRKMLLNEYQQINILSTSSLTVFSDAANYPIISLLNKDGVGNLLTMRQLATLDDLTIFANEYILPKDLTEIIPDAVFPINIDQSEINIVLKCLEQFHRLGEVFSISEGLRIPSSYEIPTKGDYHILKQYQFERYSPVREGSFINHKQLKSILRPGTDRHKKIFSEKIIIAEDAQFINATIDLANSIPQGGVYFGVIKNQEYSLLAILALLNSKLFSFLYRALFGGMHMGGGYLRYRSRFLESLPIPRFSSEINSKLAKYAQEITLGGQQEKSPFEHRIDDIIHGVYGLTPEEISIIESRLR